MQGHSPSGTPEWDWSKFEGGSGRGGVENVSGEAIATSDKPGETQVPGMWQAVPAEVKATTKANVRCIRVPGIWRDIERACALLSKW